MRLRTCPPTLYLAGYLEFVGMLFMPGLAFVELFRIFESGSLAERIGLALGLGMSIDVVLLLLRLSGYFSGTLTELSEGIAAASGIALLGSLVRRRRLALVAQPAKEDVAVALLVMVQGLLVYVHFSVYPIFPQFQSVDFSSHVQIVSDLQRGIGSPIQSGLLYYGVYMLVLELLALTGGTPFIITQRTVEILVVLSPLLVYAAAMVLSNSKRISLVATFVYAVGGFVWFGSVFNSGLYPNFYGILSSLFLIAAIGSVHRAPKSPLAWTVYLISMINALYSHYSTLTIFPAIVAVPILGVALSRKADRSLFVIAAVPVAMFGAALIQHPGVVETLQGFARGGTATNVAHDTSLSLFLSGFAFLRYAAAEISMDSSTLLLLALAAVGAYLTLRAKKPLPLLPLVWLIAIAAASPSNEGAWRFSYAALLPLTLLASFGADPILAWRPRRNLVRRRKGRRRFSEGRAVTLLVPAALLLILAGGSWGTLILYDAVNQVPQSGQAQRYVYSSMLWLSRNTPQDSSFVSITDWRYNYTSLITGRRIAYSPTTAPDDLLRQLNGTKDLYAVLTVLATAPGASASLLQDYGNNTNYRLVYKNPDVLIYRATSFKLGP